MAELFRIFNDENFVRYEYVNDGIKEESGIIAVSYTHLTLPTIYSV
ncbi:hypothetical protein CDFC105_72652 [Clostridioides difficile]|nr:hypothetical protein CDFC105_72652 [Clostridioides difficile]